MHRELKQSHLDVYITEQIHNVSTQPSIIELCVKVIVIRYEILNRWMSILAPVPYLSSNMPIRGL